MPHAIAGSLCNKGGGLPWNEAGVENLLHAMVDVTHNMVDWLVVCNHVIHSLSPPHIHPSLLPLCTHTHTHTHARTHTRTHTHMHAHTLHQVRNAAKAAFLPTDEKEELLKTLEEKLTQFEKEKDYLK